MKNNSIIEHFFRCEYGRVISYLTKTFGAENLDLAEDSVQEALIKAMQAWSLKTVPKNPTAWVTRVAKNRMIDHLRRNKKMVLENIPDIIDVRVAEKNEEPFADDLLRMLFACTSPSLKQEQQLIITLKILCGFSIAEISAALLKKEETVAKAYTRAKKAFKSRKVSIALPPANILNQRLNDVLSILYLLFNEGYKASGGSELIRYDLCDEAMRLLALLLQHETYKTPASHSLMALMLLHSARFPARLDENGIPISLQYQDRTKWNQNLISKGLFHLKLAGNSDLSDDYYLQAALSAEHCMAESWADTNWKRILMIYNRQLQLCYTPIAALNRVIAVEKVMGASVALRELEILTDTPYFENYYLFYAIRADLLGKNGESKNAQKDIDLAIQLCTNQPEKAFLTEQKRKLKEH